MSKRLLLFLTICLVLGSHSHAQQISNTVCYDYPLLKEYDDSDEVFTGELTAIESRGQGVSLTFKIVYSWKHEMYTPTNVVLEEPNQVARSLLELGSRWLIFADQRNGSLFVRSKLCSKTRRLAEGESAFPPDNPYDSFGVPSRKKIFPFVSCESMFRGKRKTFLHFQKPIEVSVPKRTPAITSLGLKGLVRARLWINIDGDVVGACVSKAHPLLRQSTLNAVMKWKFIDGLGFSDRDKWQETLFEYDVIVRL